MRIGPSATKSASLDPREASWRHRAETPSTGGHDTGVLAPGKMLLALACALVAVASGAAEAQGRPLRVDARQDLNFGLIIQGVPEVVVPTEIARAGQYRLSGRQNAEVLIDFTLPAVLTGPGGATIGIVYGGTDAGYTTAGIGAMILFDPGIPTPFFLSPQGRGDVFLGGTALTAGGVASGDYSGLVTLTISGTGN